MSYHSRPTFTAEPDQRCGALVRGARRHPYEWMRHDHRCPKGAVQMRGLTPVCHVHDRCREMMPWCAGEAK